MNREQRKVWLVVMVVGLAGFWVGGMASQVPHVAGQGQPTITREPTPTGGIPTTVATDKPFSFPTTDGTIVANGTATPESWTGGTESPYATKTP